MTEGRRIFGTWNNDGNLEKYSVLMSVYYKENAEDLTSSIESMMNQTVLCDQFVIVEDGPLTDELEAVICKYKKNGYYC